MSLDDVAATELAIEEVHVLTERIEQLEKRRRETFDALIHLQSPMPEKTFWCILPSSLRIQVSEPMAKEILERDLKNIAKELKEKRRARSFLSHQIERHGTLAEDLIERMQEQSDKA